MLKICFHKISTALLSKSNGIHCKKPNKITLSGKLQQYHNMLTISQLMKVVVRLSIQMFGHASAHKQNYKMENHLTLLQNSGFQLE